MSASVIDQPRTETQELVPVLGSHWQLSWPCVAVVGWFALVFLLINHTPLSLQNTWKYANAGHWISLHGAIPDQIPNVPLSSGMDYFAHSWLFDSTVAMVASRFGPEAVSASIAVLTSVALWLWSWLIYRMSHSVVYVLFSAVMISLAWSSGFGFLHPRLAGAVLLGSLVWLISPARPFGQVDKEDVDREARLGISRWLGVGLLFAVWANVDISFLVGWLMLLAIALGHLISDVKRLGFRGLSSFDTVRWTWMLQLAVIATGLTPHGLGLWQYLVTAGVNELTSVTIAGGGMYLPTIAGAALMWFLGYSVWRLAHSETSPSHSEILVLIFMVLATAINARLLFWFAPLAMLITSRHWLSPEMKSKLTEAPVEEEGEAKPLRFAATLTCLLFIWCGFALSPISAPVLDGEPRSHATLFDASVPSEVSVFLAEELDTDMSPSLAKIWAPADWADWLLWDGPAELEVFANSDVGRMPQRVQLDYMRIFQGEAGWDDLLDRYAIGTLVVDKTRQVKLSREVMRNSRWKLMHETETSLTLQRIRRITQS